MNIFVLDKDITRCARYHCDQHVVKMILESVQLLCTALNKKGFTTPYKSTHVKHPCVLWVEESYDNFQWLVELTHALNTEYRFRYEKDTDHKSMAALAKITDIAMTPAGLTDFPQAMPDGTKSLAMLSKPIANFTTARRWASPPGPNELPHAG